VVLAFHFSVPGTLKGQCSSYSLAAKFRGMKPRNEQRNTCTSISRIAKVDEYPPIRPVAITADHMSADKGMAGSVSGPVGIRGTMFLGEKKKKAENLLCRSGYVTLRGAPRKRSTPEVKDKRRTIPLRRKQAIRRALLAAEPVPIPEGNRRSKSLPKVVNSKNSENPNHPPSMVK
jgi:hypothetical protein